MDIEQSSTLDDWELHTEGPALGGSATQGDLDLFYNTNFKGSFEHTNGNYYSISDERLKTNIKPMSSMLEKINQLKPSVYQFKNTTDKQEYDGFIAQEVIKIFPGLVMHTLIPDRNLDVYTMNYSGFGVIAIKGIQELQPVLEEQNQKIIALEGAYQLKITSLEERIEKLEEALVAFTSNNEKSMSFITGNGSLAQNKPNPFFKNTAIRYNIGKGSKGQISIYDETGKLVKVFNTNDNGMLQVSANDFAAGTYTYTLKIDGKVSSSKQMVLMK